MKISRQIGTVSQILQLYAQDASVSTGAGLANVFASNVTYSWFRSNQNGVSTAAAGSTATLGIFSSGAWKQIDSTNAKGWYQFGLPNDALLSGDSVGIHIYVSSGPLTIMAPLPVEIELTKTNNQQYMSSQTVGFVQNGVNVTSMSSAVTTTANVVQIYGSAAVTSASGQYRVSTQAIDKGGYGVTTVASAVTTNANLLQVYGVAVVTSASGILTVSTQTLGAFTVAGVNVTAFAGSAVATSGAGILNVSTQAIDKGGYGVTTISAAITTNANVIQAYGSAIVTSASGQFRVSTQTLGAFTVAGVNVTAFAGSAIVTSGAGILNVSTQTMSYVTSSDVASSSQIIQGVWNELYTAYTSVSSSFGQSLFNAQSASGLTSSQVGDAVWSRINSSYSGVSTFGYVLKQVTSISAGVNVTSLSGTITTNANVIQAYGSAIVTSASGQFRVSTQAIDKGGYGVTTIASNITSNANVVQWLGVGAVGANGYPGVDWGNVTNKAAYNDLSSTFISTNQSIAGASAPTAAQVAVAVWGEINSSSVYSNVSTFGYVVKQVTSISGGGGSGSVNVTSIAGQPVVTTGAGVLLVSTQTIPTFASSSDARFIFLDVSVSSRAASSDSRLGNLDGSISSRAASSDARLARLDVSVSSRAADGAAMALTAGERATLAGVILTTTQSESFRADGSPGSLTQIAYEVLANLTEFSNSGTTRTLGSVTSGALGVATYQYNSTTPSAITRVS